MSQENKLPSIEIISVEDQEDGSAIITFDMDKDSLRHFAGIGVLKVLTDAARDMIKEEENK